MVKFFFSLGYVDRRLIIPLINSINYIISNVWFYFFPEDDVNLFFYYIGLSIGEMLVILVPYIFRFQNKSDQSAICTKPNIIDYFFLFLFDILILLYTVASYYFEDDNSFNICSFDSITITLICVLTAVFLKYKYYIHHYICLVVFLILSIIIDLMADNFKNQHFSYIVIRLSYMFIDACAYCYYKYLMDIKYRHFWNISFFLGVFELFFFSLTFAILYIIRTTYNKNVLLSALDDYKEGKTGDIIFRLIYGIIFGGFITFFLELETINIFDPNYIFVTYEISRIADILLNAEGLTDWLSIIPFTFQIIILLFYLEIFEFNFCNLNKNTKRNIRLRERKDTSILNDEKEINVIELNQGYYLKDKEEIEEKEQSISFGNFETVVKKKFNKK